MVLIGSSLSRRDFHKAALASLLAAMATPLTAQTQAANPTRIILNRLTFGATPETIAEFDQLGLAAWLDSQFSMPVTSSDLKQRLTAAKLHIAYEAGEQESGATYPAIDEMRGLSRLAQDPAELLDLLNFELPFDYSERLRPADEVVAAALIRAVHTQAQLREVMTQFWHDHFNVNAYKSEATAVFFPVYDATLRNLAFGNFRAMLEAVATSPSMLIYLNNDESRASPANENYARELLELHTLGATHYYNDLYDDWAAVPGAKDGLAEGYIDQDVYEVARAFTGWSVGDGRYVNDGMNTPRDGHFAYVESWHDPYQKRILGVEFSAHTGPMEDGQRVLDILARHPGTAQFVSAKIMRRLGIEDPAADYADRIAAIFLAQADAPDQIAQVIRAIVTDEAFLATPPDKLRRPFEVLTALYRNSGAQIASPQLTYTEFLRAAGWTQHAVRPPTGHSDSSVTWANTRTINGTVTLALAAHEEWFEAADPAVFAQPPQDARTWGDLGWHWLSRFDATQQTFDAWVTLVDVDPQAALPKDDPDWVGWAVRSALVLATVTPNMMFR
jgi:uncharacterized protein (DUF1800 family)